MKILIADDEIRICQLIETLIERENLGMKVAGLAYNGVEAYKQVKELNPDILITDIRMPGCSGLELIEQIKKIRPDIQIIIISGYAHFEYARQAIKFGVEDYLLKPISKTELVSTLEKLRQKIQNQRMAEKSQEELIEQNRSNIQQLQTELLWRLMDRDEMPSEQTLRETYHVNIQNGLFQAIYVKTDVGQEEFDRISVSVIMDKVQALLEQFLGKKCSALILDVKDFSCVGIMNYPIRNQEEIRKALRNCMNQLESQKNLFHQVSFSIALGTAVREPELLGESLQEASLLIQERLIKGTGRVLERLGPPSELRQSNILEKYLREIGNILDSLSEEQAGKAVQILEDEVYRVKDARGYEVLNIIYSAADIFSVRAEIPDRSICLEEFQRRCEQCGRVEDLFVSLKTFQNSYLQELSRKRNEDTVRPIRKAKLYIQNHYGEAITLEEVCSEVGLSASYFSSLFKKTEGVGFVKYLTNIRMEQAKILLRESNLSLTEICQKVGYTDQKHFTRTFEKHTGIRPGVYRKLYG